MERQQEDWTDGGFLDASGITMLAEVGRLRDADALRVVPSPAPEVTRMLDLTGIGSLIRLPSDAARRALPRRPDRAAPDQPSAAGSR